MLADRGLLDYDAPVETYWPEFGCNGKEGVSVRTLLNHRLGVVGLDTDFPVDDIDQKPERIARLLERQRPLWPAGSDQGLSRDNLWPVRSRVVSTNRGGDTGPVS